MATDDTNSWLYSNSLYTRRTRAETAVCADTMLPTSVCIVDMMKDYRRDDIPNTCFWLTRWFHTLVCSVREIRLCLTWRCRGCCHQDTPSAWCSPWLCRGWKSAWSGRRTRQEPRSSWPDVRQRCGSCCCWRGRPGGRPASSASGTASWWSPGDKAARAQRSGTPGGLEACQRHVPCSLQICCRCSQPARQYQQEELNLQKVKLCQNISILHESSVCTSARDYACVNPAVELWHKPHPTDATDKRMTGVLLCRLKSLSLKWVRGWIPHLTASCTAVLQTEIFDCIHFSDIWIKR